MIYRLLCWLISFYESPEPAPEPLAYAAIYHTLGSDMIPVYRMELSEEGGVVFVIGIWRTLSVYKITLVTLQKKEFATQLLDPMLHVCNGDTIGLDVGVGACS